MPIFNPVLKGMNTKDATAKAGDIVEGKTAWANGSKLTGTLVSAQPKIVSTTTITMPNSASWASVCYGNGKFVAVANSSSSSSTGSSSTVGGSGSNAGNTGMGGTTVSAYSTDGINWTKTTLPTSTVWSSVCYGNGKFVAVSKGSSAMGTNKSAYSTDGINWYTATLPASATWNSVCYGDGKFVAVSQNYNGSSRQSTFAYSTDGINWTASTLSGSLQWSSVCYGNGGFIAVAYSTYAYSTDGINWRLSRLPNTVNYNSVCYGNGKFVAVSGGSASNFAAYSTDGINWTASTLSGSLQWSSVCYGNGGFIAVASGGTDVSAYSTDGINWTETILSASTPLSSVCYGDGKFVAVSNNSSNTSIMLTNCVPPNYTNWGTAQPSDVREGVTFTSNEGFTLDGTMKSGSVTQSSDPVEVYKNTRPADWLPMPEPQDNEMYLLFHIPDGVSALLAFTVTCTGNYTVSPGTVTDGRFSTSSSTNIASGSKYEAELSASDYGNLTSDGMKQCMVKISGTDILTWKPSTHTKKTNPSDFAGWNIVDISCKLPEGTKMACEGLKKLKYFSWYGANAVTDMSNMFCACYSLTSIPQLNTSSVTNMINMFSNCYSLTSIPQLNTSSVTNTIYMFSNCHSLTSIPQLDTSSVMNMINMFSNCYSLASVLLNPAVTNWAGQVIRFSGCSLGHAAIVALFNSLPTITSSKALTLTDNPGVSELTDEEKAIATSKNWTLNL